MYKKFLLPTYKYGLFALFINTISPWFFWKIGSLVVVFCFFVTVYALVKTPYHFLLNKEKVLVIYLLCLFFCTLCLTANLNGIVGNLMNFFCVASLFCLRDDNKMEILNFITKGFAVVVLISLVAFLLFFVLNVPWRYDSVVYADVYRLRNFYLFLTSEWDSPFLFPRFQAVFVEPGHFGMISSLLLFVQSYNLKKWYNFIIFLGALFSMSLASYVLMLIGILIIVFIKYKHLIKYVVLIIAFSGVIISIMNRVVGEYNIFNQLIVERLVFEDGKLAGNNRFTLDFERDYEQKVETSAVWFGWQPSFSQYEGGNAGYKRYISDYGIIGLLICFLTYISFCKGYPRQYAYSLLLLYAISFLQRAYPFWASELIIFICGLPLMRVQSFSSKAAVKV